MNLNDLTKANIERQKFWDPEDKLDLLYRSNELMGEAGEAANVVKKLKRAELGLVGSRDTIEHLGEEIADIIICASLLALKAGINLEEAVKQKFNKTSDAIGSKIKL